MNRIPNIPFNQLVDLVENRVSAEVREQLLTQIAADSKAMTDLTWLVRILDLMRNDDSEDAPDYVINRAIRLFRQRRKPDSPNLLRRIAAVLRFDSMQAPLAFGLRSGSTLPRQLLYGAEGRDLDLRINPAGTLWRVAGQILGPDEDGFVELCGPSIRVQTRLNALSEFSLPPVPAGNYTLTIHQADLEITIDELGVGLSS